MRAVSEEEGLPPLPGLEGSIVTQGFVSVGTTMEWEGSKSNFAGQVHEQKDVSEFGTVGVGSTYP